MTYDLGFHTNAKAQLNAETVYTTFRKKQSLQRLRTANKYHIEQPALCRADEEDYASDVRESLLASISWLPNE